MQSTHPCRKRITNEIINIQKTMPSYQIYELNKVYDAMQLADASNKEFLNKLAAAVAKIRNGLVK